VYANTNLVLSGSSVFFNSSSGSTGRELWAIPASAGVDTGVTAPNLIGAPASSMVAIPITYLNTGLVAATAITLTATLDPQLVYVDDTSGITRSVSGPTLTWRLPGAGFLDGRDFRLRLRLPDALLGTRLPVELRLVAAGPDGQTSSDVVQIDVMVADVHYLPVAR
jgi:hypothetical protein